MVRLFFDHLGGSLYYNCANCENYLSNHREIISKSVRCGTGIAWLFKHVVNIREATNAERRLMNTGFHYVKDVFCKKCSQKVGWVYELAENEDQQYKEGKVILERSLIKAAAVSNPKLAERWDLDTNQHVPDPPPMNEQDQEAEKPSRTPFDTSFDIESQGSEMPPLERAPRMPGTPLPSEGGEIFEYPASNASLDVNFDNSPRHSTATSEIRAIFREIQNLNRHESWPSFNRSRHID